jgi:kynurenine 3-monooxygenase
MKKIVIIGAGPCGILLAHYLLRRSANYQIEIYDRREDPRQVEFPTHRSHSINISKRGLTALSAIPGLEPAVQTKGVMNGGRTFHFQNGKMLSMQKRTQRLSINRNAFVIEILSQLTQNYDESRLKLHFNCKYVRADFTSKIITFQRSQTDCATTPSQTPYDVLIGADGVNSAVRGQLQAAPGVEMERPTLPWLYKTLTLQADNQPSDARLAPRSIHLWKLGFLSAFSAIPKPDNTFSCIIGFHKDHNPLAGLSTPQEILQFFQQSLGSASQLITLSEAEAFLNKPYSTVSALRCNRYHQGDSVLILGDAAHAISPLIGQGCNASLEDVAILDRLLDEYADDWSQALPQFSLRRHPDADALFELNNNVVPIAQHLWIEFLLKASVQSFLYRRFPRYFFPSLPDSITETTLPYSEILSRYRGWIERVRRSNARVLDAHDSEPQPFSSMARLRQVLSSIASA